ncbi:MAG TPA: anti-sigma factor [Devosia sp.]|jgi:anti-sigma factor RsiW|uniref:anti-sigma factor family protein n=1 Tax=Devosia sp. TaxID=1871048 RepID=UPI002DDC9625|nr:anti-sigma factor [Devosia sp.]HEV2514563.1 anti-sigma factor [Devosia sp.]
MTNLAPISETDLHAYVDGQLPPERAAEVEAWLATHPDKAAELAGWQRQNEALTALFGSTADETVPSRLDPRLIARSPAANRSVGWAQAAAAAVVTLVLGGALGWAGRDYFSPPPRQELIASAVTAHALYVKEKRHAVEVAASDKDHLVSWLSNRVERPINPPDLAADGFTLVGGRLLPGYGTEPAGPAAQLMYENAAQERVTVYITAALPDRRADKEFTARNNLDAFYWANDKITCTVVGDLPEAQMQAVAKKVYQQLTWRPDGTPGGNWGV